MRSSTLIHFPPHYLLDMFPPHYSLDMLPGGWVMFTARMFHSAVSWIAHECQMVVVSVDYQRAPEHPFPRPLLDVYHTVLWAQLNAAKLGEVWWYLQVHY